MILDQQVRPGQLSGSYGAVDAWTWSYGEVVVVAVTTPPQVCTPGGFGVTNPFYEFALSGEFNRFDLTTDGITVWAEDC